MHDGKMTTKGLRYMIMTYDWLSYAQNHLEFKKQIEDAIFCGEDCELTLEEIYRIKFDSKTQSVVVEPFSENSNFHWKIVPKRITYRAVLQMMSGDWNNLSEEDIQDV